MEDLDRLFTDRKMALSAVGALARSGGGQRVLLLTGLSGMGKSTVLTYAQAHPPRGWTYAVVDAEALLSGMAVRSEGAEEAALELLRRVGGHLATLAPWWRRRRLRRKAALIGHVRPWRVSVRQWAGFGGSISKSPVEVTAGTLTQGQQRGQWTDQLLTVARGVRRGRLVLMVDTCELLTYFDDVRAEQPRDGKPYGVGGWFSGVVDQLLDAMPHLSVVLAGTTAPAMATTDDYAGNSVGHVELQGWIRGDTRRYLARRGLQVDAEVAAAVTDAEGGLPVTISWIANVLTGLLTDKPAGPPPADFLAQLTGPGAPTGPARTKWLRDHVLDRLSERTLHLLRAAAVLETFTPAALLAVARTNHPADADAFTRLARASCITPQPAGHDGQSGPDGHWRLHAVMRGWLIDNARAHDAQQPTDQRILPGLHRAAADYYEALAGDGGWSLEAARHRFATGDNTHTAAWTARLAAALQATPPDTLQIQLLTDAALDSGDCENTLPAIAADAHLAAGFLAYQLAQFPAAQDHAEHALALYRTIGTRRHAIYVSACLAGQAAWKRPRCKDTVEHWTTALTFHPVPTSTDPGSLARPDDLSLHTALAEATLTTGDAPRARALLEQLTFSARTGERVANSSDAVGTDQPTQAVEHAMPAIVPGDPVPSERHPAHTHLLHAEAALILDDYDQAAAYAQQILDDPAAGLHHTALAHRLLARIDLRAWNLRQADQHLHNATTAAQQCPDQRCMVHLLLTRAELAELKAVWSRPQESPTTISTSVSLTQYTEAAHQKELAARERIAAASLATDLKDPLLQAHAIVNTAPGEALALYRTLGDRRGEAHTLVALADGLRMRGDVDGAQDHATQALTLFRTLGNRQGEAEILLVLAAIARVRGDVGGADKHATQALTLFHSLRERRSEAETLRMLAEVARLRGDVDGADEHATQALTLFRTLGDPLGQADTLLVHAHIARLRGDLRGAQEHATQALTLYRTLGDPLGQANSLLVHADVARLRGDLRGADEHATQALTLYRTLDKRRSEAETLRMLADNARRDGRAGDGRRQMEEAAELYEALGLPKRAAQCRQELREW
ncbi:hypothetical protein ABZ904_34955 [Streptomyces sp. NPDC046900]|uniref:hypothetical protein n=1 Tax=Streptomyces sp. NPDC046900 TaxID=3155473 RepID=UPI0033EC4D0C